MSRLLAAISLIIATLASAQGEESDTRQGCISPTFRTLQIRQADDMWAPPVINLNNDSERIVVSFDELADEHRYLRYSLTHCDAEWMPEGLVDSEFLDSFNEGTVDDYEYSQATVVHYVHYAITIPNNQIRITQPGNYLLRVYDERDPDNTLVQARFGAADFSATVRATVSSRTDIDSNKSHQQLDISLDTRHVNVEDPFNDIKVVITQNGRHDNEAIIAAPQRILGKDIVYEHMRQLIFPAGNEYRRFDISSVNYPGTGVERMIHDASIYNAVLHTDGPRSNESYLYDQTQHGRFLVRSTDTEHPDTEADYVLTHFTLDMPPIAGYDIFIDGDITSRTFGPSSRMIYNHASGCYEQSLLLKQGAYNYQYLAVPADRTEGETAPIEGDKHQTINEYTIKVYHRPKGTRFDRLIGVTSVTSGI